MGSNLQHQGCTHAGFTAHAEGIAVRLLLHCDDLSRSDLPFNTIFLTNRTKPAQLVACPSLLHVPACCVCNDRNHHLSQLGEHVEVVFATLSPNHAIQRCRALETTFQRSIGACLWLRALHHVAGDRSKHNLHIEYDFQAQSLLTSANYCKGRITGTGPDNLCGRRDNLGGCALDLSLPLRVLDRAD